MSRYRYGADEASPFEDDYRGFDIRDDETARGPLILALAIGVLKGALACHSGMASFAEAGVSDG